MGFEDDSAGGSRYSAVSRSFHWIIAALITANFVLAFSFDEYLESADPAQKAIGFQLINWHKSIGISVLALSLLRLGWRLTHAFPALPAHMPSSQQALARLTHYGFYVLMIWVPLAGWLMVGTGRKLYPISFFGLFDLPHIVTSADHATHELLEGAHVYAAFAMLGLLALHVAGALKHHFIDRDDVLARMVPGLRPRR